MPFSLQRCVTAHRPAFATLARLILLAIAENPGIEVLVLIHDAKYDPEAIAHLMQSTHSLKTLSIRPGFLWETKNRGSSWRKPLGQIRPWKVSSFPLIPTVKRLSAKGAS